jgi:hypothetical protein
MSNHIIEYIGQNKLIHTDGNILRSRWKKPKPGDPIDFGEDYKNNPYPYNTARYGRVEGKPSWVREDEIHICCELGSAFWGLFEESQKSYVSISGGPFATVKDSDLEPAYILKSTPFWNWGNNMPGGGQGVDYLIYRPLFCYRPSPSVIG